jgi:hypothetical protein
MNVYVMKAKHDFRVWAERAVRRASAGYKFCLKTLLCYRDWSRLIGGLQLESVAKSDMATVRQLL